ncbi:MAG: hypothetical protein ACREQ9_26580 [Candidatus Binatia bacterium]
MREIVMAARKQNRKQTSPLETLFSTDRRDRRPGTHFASEFGSPRRSKDPARDEPHVDEDLGCSEFGIDLPFLRRE